MSQHPLPENLHIDTLAVRTAVDRSQYGENSEAMYLTSGYVQPDAETAARRFAGEEEGYTYSRLGNPTVTSLELRLAAMEGAEACIATSTGMSSILLMCLGLLKSGDHVICSHSLFGSTIKLIGGEFAKFGVETSFVSQTDVAEWKAANARFAASHFDGRRFGGSLGNQVFRWPRPRHGWRTVRF